MKSADSAGRRHFAIRGGKLDVGRIVCALIAGAACLLSLGATAATVGFKQFKWLSWLPFEGASAKLACIVILAVSTAVVVYLVLGYHRKPAAPEKLPWLRFDFDFKHIAIVSAVLFACWLPLLILKYPCALNEDTINQLYQFQVSAPTWYTTLDMYLDGEFIDHHPVFDTLLYGAFLSLGEALGSQNVGMFILVILQSLALAAVLGSACCYGTRLGAPRWLIAVAVLFCAFFPRFPNSAAEVVKDTTFLIPWVAFFICWIEVARTRGEALHSRSLLVAIIIWGGLCVLTKKLGIYIVAPSLLVLLLACPKARKESAISLVALVAVFAIALPAVVYPAIGGVAPGGKQETLSFALQQVVAVELKNPDSISAEEQEAVTGIMDLEEAKESFRSSITDPVKSTMKHDASNEEIAAFLRAWVSIGIKNPGLYLSTTAATTYKLFVPTKYMDYSSIPRSNIDENYECSKSRIFEGLGTGYHVTLHRPAALVELDNHYDSLVKKIWGIPITSLFFTAGFYGGVLPFLCFLVAFRNRRRETLLVYVPVALTMFFVFISPISTVRYMLPLLGIAPLLVMHAWCSLPKRAEPSGSRQDGHPVLDSRASAAHEGSS